MPINNPAMINAIVSLFILDPQFCPKTIKLAIALNAARLAMITVKAALPDRIAIFVNPLVPDTAAIAKLDHWASPYCLAA